MIRLIKAEIADNFLIHEMQQKAFQPLLDKYRDYETNPVNESIERVTEKIKGSSFFKIVDDESMNVVGAIRIIQRHNRNWISPIFILPEYQGKGFAQKAMQLAEEIFTDCNTWELQTILEEKGNCYLYEKLGYKQTDFKQIINERMTLIGYKKIKED